MAGKGKSRGRAARLVETVPAVIYVPVLPNVGKEALDAGTLSALRSDRFFSLPTTFEEAERNRESIQADYLGRYAADPRLLQELLDLFRGEFVHEREVRDFAASFIRDEQWKARRRGRPIGHSKRVFQTNLAIARFVEGLKHSTGMKQEHIMNRLIENGFEGLGESVLRHSYYEGRRHALQKAVLFTREDEKRVSAATRNAPDRMFVVRSVGVMMPSSAPPVRVTGVHFNRGVFTITLEAA